jgi:hypothetical protein
MNWAILGSRGARNQDKGSLMPDEYKPPYSLSTSVSPKSEGSATFQ